jgi:hypothetical protein
VRLLVAALLLITLAASPAVAGYGQVFDLGEQAPVPGKKTWRDLLGQLFHDLRQEPQKDGKIADVIHGSVDIRPIDKESFADCPGSEPLPLKYLDYADVEIGDEPRLIIGITTDGDSCFGALALFDGSVQGDAKLLDVVDIKQDANYFFGDGFVRPLGSDGQLVVADSFHTTTSVAPDNDVLVLATIDRLTLVGNVDAQSEVDCQHHRTIGEKPYVVVTPDYGAFDRITGYIKRTVQPVGDDCSTAAGKPTVTITRTDWRWDPIKKAYRRATP